MRFDGNSTDRIGVEVFTLYMDEGEEYSPLELEQEFQQEVERRKDPEPALFYKIMTQTDWDDDNASSNLQIISYRWETDEEFDKRQIMVAERKKVQLDREAELQREKEVLMADPDFLLFQDLHKKYIVPKNKHKL